MLEEKLEIFEALLTTFFKCEGVKLDKIFKLLRETRLIYGEEIFRKSIRQIIEWGFTDYLNGAYYCVLTNIVSELVNIEELDGGSYTAILDANFNDHRVRFTLEDFKYLPVSFDEKNEITQKINEFIALTNL